MTEQRAGAPRSIVELDVATGTVRMGEAERRVGDLSDPAQLYPAYLSLLYAVRGARRGEEIPLRSADIEALLEVIGDDPDYIERKLVELMGCTDEEASFLRRVLVRHRALAASAGAVAGISLVALIGPTGAGATTELVPTPSSASTVSSAATITPADPTELPPLPSYATTDDGAHVPVPQSWTETEGTVPQEQLPAASVSLSSAPTPSVAPSVTPSVIPSAAPSASTSPSPSPSASTSPAPAPAAVAPQAPPEEEVVLGEPMAPIDRPGWSPADEVVLGEPMVPIDRVETPAAEQTEPVDPNEGTPRIGWTPDYPVEPEPQD